MNLTEKFELVRQQKAELHKSVLNVKPEFEAFIKNREIPILERWNIFCHAEQELHNHQEQTVHFDSEDLKYMQDYYFSNADVHNQITNVDLIKEFNMRWLSEDKKAFQPDAFPFTKNSRIATEFLIEAMEEILHKNLGSYTLKF